jgi:gamma-glutamyltranspeptidase
MLAITIIFLLLEGYPVGPHTARQWSQGFLQGAEALRVLFKNGRAPVAGEIFTNPDLAETFVRPTIYFWF